MTVLFDKKLIIDRREKFKAGLVKYIPENALNPVCKLLAKMPVFVKITKNRKSKLGDFRAAHNGKPHTITLNYDLDPYTFFITLVHEMAHLECWLEHKNKAKPHGDEWKKAYKKLMLPFLEMNFLPQDVAENLVHYMNNPLASSCTDVRLMRTLRNYNKSAEITFLEDLPDNAVFSLNDKRVFQKGEKRRKLFKCKELKSKKIYLINPLCEVKPVEPANP